jgi:single-strand DNA-binding protein
VQLTDSCFSSFHLIAWHCFGRKPCARHRRSFCFLQHHPNNFVLICSLRSLMRGMKFLRSPRESTHWVWEHAPLALGCPGKRAESEKFHMINQLTIIGFIGRNAETKQLSNGSVVTKFSVATTKSWKDDKGEWKEKTQWHTVLGFGQGFAQSASRLVKGAHVFVQGELTTREYDRTITVPVGEKTVEHVIQQVVVELKAETIRILDRGGNTASAQPADLLDDEDVPL